MYCFLALLWSPSDIQLKQVGRVAHSCAWSMDSHKCSLTSGMQENKRGVFYSIKFLDPSLPDDDTGCSFSGIYQTNVWPWQSGTIIKSTVPFFLIWPWEHLNCFVEKGLIGEGAQRDRAIMGSEFFTFTQLHVALAIGYCTQDQIFEWRKSGWCSPYLHYHLIRGQCLDPSRIFHPQKKISKIWSSILLMGT